MRHFLKLVFAFSLLLWCHSLMAQHFSYDIDLSQASTYSASTNILQKNDSSYFIYGVTVLPGINSNNQACIALINNSGQIINIFYLGDTTWKYYPGLRSAIFYDHKGNIVCVGSRFNASNPSHIEGYLLIFNDTLSLISESFYSCAGPLNDTGYVFNSGVSTYDNGYAIVGYKTTTTEGYAGLLKIDSTGQIIWNRNYGNGGVLEYSGAIVQQLPDSGFLIGGHTEKVGYYHSSDPLVIKTDQYGNLDWYRQLGGPHSDGPGMISYVTPNLYIAAYQHGTTNLGMANVRSRVGVTALDSTGTIVYQKSFLEEMNSLGVYGSYLHSSGQLLICGTRRGVTYQHLNGWILSIDTYGDSLWMREYSHLTGPSSANLLWDITEGANGNIVACGELWPFSPDTGPQRTWLLGMDSIGCLQPYCDSTIVNDEISAMGFKLYPNPSSGTLSIDIQKQTESFSYEVYSSSGQELANGQAGPFPGTCNLDLNDLSDGLYFIVLHLPDQSISRKFIINRRKQ